MQGEGLGIYKFWLPTSFWTCYVYVKFFASLLYKFLFLSVPVLCCHLFYLFKFKINIFKSNQINITFNCMAPVGTTLLFLKCCPLFISTCLLIRFTAVTLFQMNFILSLEIIILHYVTEFMKTNNLFSSIRWKEKYSHCDSNMCVFICIYLFDKYFFLLSLVCLC